MPSWLTLPHVNEATHQTTNSASGQNRARSATPAAAYPFRQTSTMTAIRASVSTPWPVVGPTCRRCGTSFSAADEHHGDHQHEAGRLAGARDEQPGDHQQSGDAVR